MKLNKLIAEENSENKINLVAPKHNYCFTEIQKTNADIYSKPEKL